MKIKFWDRFLLFLGALLTVCAGAYLAFLAFQNEEYMIPRLAVGILTALFGVYLFVFPRKYSGVRGKFVVQYTDDGEFRISVKAIEGLVQKCIDTHEEIKLVSSRITSHRRKGVTVDLRISLANNIAIPLAVASLQKQIKQYLTASSGIDLEEVRVVVETTEADVGNSPYIVHAEPAPVKQPEPETPAKVPLHRRLFRKSDEPATVPEPPQPAPEKESPAQEAPVQDESPAEPQSAEQPEPTADVNAEMNAEEAASGPSDAPETQEEDTSHE